VSTDVRGSAKNRPDDLSPGDRADPGPASVRGPDRLGADTDEAGHTFQQEAGHRFRFEAGRGSDLMSATWGLLPRIEVMMFGLAGLVKRGWIWASASCEEGRVRVGRIGGGG
jgi:hypothetical protein